MPHIRVQSESGSSHRKGAVCGTGSPALRGQVHDLEGRRCAPKPQTDAGRSQLTSQLRAAQGKVQGVSRAALKCGPYVTQPCRAPAGSSCSRGEREMSLRVRSRSQHRDPGGPWAGSGPCVLFAQRTQFQWASAFEQHQETGCACKEIQGHSAKHAVLSLKFNIIAILSCSS